ncbi:MAG: DUF1320 family protein [Ignavibacteriaceae bacterium]|nr:DUF1320 family protein [Ignavibacteriaceae bacterium]
MYTDINKIVESLTLAVFLNLMNDEQRTPKSSENEDGYDLTDDTDILVIRTNDLISKSDREIDSYLRNRYNLPLNNTPSEIEELSTRKTIKRMFERRHRTDMPDSIITQDSVDNKYLISIQKGDVNPDIPEQLSNADNIIKSNKSRKRKKFTDDYLRDY